MNAPSDENFDLSPDPQIQSHSAKDFPSPPTAKVNGARILQFVHDEVLLLELQSKGS